ncbi:MAG TPA: FAD:protein FMN transferase [Jatrophihabitantaceae bacterium]
MTATHTERAWSCAVRLVVDDERVLRNAAADLHTLLLQVDSAASRFRADSALSYANDHAGRPVAVPRLLADLVDAALRVAEHTDGAVDPTIGRAMSAIGYDRDIRLVAATGPTPTTVLPVRTWRDVRLAHGAGLLRVPAGTALDLGATAKAYTADLAARTLARRYDTAVLVELGGDVAVAGARAQGWRIRVAEHAGGTGQLVSQRAGGLATSTTTVRRWRRGEQIVHHIVDPRTGASARGTWRTASVAAADALHANAASTAAIVLGERAVAWLEAHGYAARLVAADGSVHVTSGWPTVGVAAA